MRLKTLLLTGSSLLLVETTAVWAADAPTPATSTSKNTVATKAAATPATTVPAPQNAPVLAGLEGMQAVQARIAQA